MGLIDSIIGAVTGASSATSEESGGHPLMAALAGLLEQNGGLSGLLGQFSQHGLGEVASSWVGLSENRGITAEQIQSVLGNDQIAGIASKLGLNAEQASGLLSQYLPKIIDKLTPSGQIDGNVDFQQEIASLLPSLLDRGASQWFVGGSPRE
jgi:uncharacterized protein YidB (DUF937 family)